MEDFDTNKEGGTSLSLAKNKNVLLMSFAIIVALLVGISVIIFIQIGGINGVKTRSTWAALENYLNYYTDDDFKVVEQNKNSLVVSFDGNNTMNFACHENPWYAIDLPSGFRCSFIFYVNNGKTTKSLGGYYLNKNMSEVNALVNKMDGIYVTSIEYGSYESSRNSYRLSFSSNTTLKEFFYSLIKIEDFKNMWNIYKNLAVTLGEVKNADNSYDFEKVSDQNPARIINPNGIYLEKHYKNKYDYMSLFDYAYKAGWR